MGAGGDNRVWLNSDTEWTYRDIYAAELATRRICTQGKWKENAAVERIVKQLCRELLLLESSDWQFLITTGAARDYAESRFSGHVEQFRTLENMYQTVAAGGDLSPDQEKRLSDIEMRDDIFADLDPRAWEQKQPPDFAEDRSGPSGD